MKAEIAFSEEIIEAIAQKIIELIPKHSCNNNAEDVIYDVEGLSEYLKVSKKWIYERSHLKEIPHIKIEGKLLFRRTEIDKWLNNNKIPCIS